LINFWRSRKLQNSTTGCYCLLQTKANYDDDDDAVHKMCIVIHVKCRLLNYIIQVQILMTLYYVRPKRSLQSTFQKSADYWCKQVQNLEEGDFTSAYNVNYFALTLAT